MTHIDFTNFLIIYSEKAKTFCEILTLLLTVCTVVKSKVKITQNFVAFSEYMNFKKLIRLFSKNSSNQGVDFVTLLKQAL